MLTPEVNLPEGETLADSGNNHEGTVADCGNNPKETLTDPSNNENQKETLTRSGAMQEEMVATFGPMQEEVVATFGHYQEIRTLIGDQEIDVNETQMNAHHSNWFYLYNDSSTPSSPSTDLPLKARLLQLT